VWDAEPRNRTAARSARQAGQRLTRRTRWHVYRFAKPAGHRPREGGITA
jgi:hypothetical protein